MCDVSYYNIYNHDLGVKAAVLLSVFYLQDTMLKYKPAT